MAGKFLRGARLRRRHTGHRRDGEEDDATIADAKQGVEAANDVSRKVREGVASDCETERG